MHLPVFKAPDFAVPHDVAYGFYGRQGGVSAPPYASLNVGRYGEDQKADIQENFRRIALDLRSSLAMCTPYPICTVSQIHSAVCVRIFEGTLHDPSLEADALVTACRGRAIGIVTADCAPVLFWARQGNGDPVIGAAHAGWRGAVSGVLEATIQAMLRYPGVQREGIQACIGPAIGLASYEVQDDMRDLGMRGREGLCAVFSSRQ